MMPPPPMTSHRPTYICAVDISRNRFNDTLDKVSRRLADSDTTVSLDISHNRIREGFGDGTEVHFGTLKLLRSLDASNNSLKGLVNFGQNSRSIETVVLSDNDFAGIYSVPQLPPSLKRLDLRNNPNFTLDSEHDFEALSKSGRELVVHEGTGKGKIGQQATMLLCAMMQRRAHPETDFLLPPLAVDYKGCRCAKGWGNPPFCQVEAFLANRTSDRLPVKGQSTFSVRQGRTAKWLIQPASGARVVYLTFIRFETFLNSSLQTIPISEVKLDVFLGDSARGEKVLSYTKEHPPKLDGSEVMAGNEYHTNGTVCACINT